jgi:hypothetical protein
MYPCKEKPVILDNKVLDETRIITKWVLRR